MPYAVSILHKDDPDSWHWLPFCMERIARFCREYEGHGNPDALIASIQKVFVTDDPGLIVLAYFQDDTLIGHMLCDLSLLYFQPIVTVHQLMLDHGVPPDIRHQAIALVKDWARKHDCEQIQWLVRSQELATLYKRFYGAKPHLLLMRTTAEDKDAEQEEQE